MNRCWVLATVVIMWAGFAPALSFAQQGATLCVSDVVAVSEDQTAIIGTTTAELADIGFAYYEIVDDFGLVDAGFLPVLPDGSYRVYLTTDLQQTIMGDPAILLYRPFDLDGAPPVQVNYMMASDSVTATFTRIMATGDAAQIRAFLQLIRETGQLSAQLEARLLVVQAAETAAAIVARQIAAARAAETAVVTARNIRGLVTDVIRGMRLHGLNPANSPSTRAILQEAVRVTRAAIDSLRTRLADPRNARQADSI